MVLSTPVGFLCAYVAGSVKRNARWWDTQVLPNQHRMARELWERAIRPGDSVIDATCGRGKDTLALSAMTGPTGVVYAFDIQREAINQTMQTIEDNLPEQERPKIMYLNESHENFPASIAPSSISCIVYNLGWLPGENADKSILTKADTTISSIATGLSLLRPGGVMTVTTYVQQDGGEEEEQMVLDLTSQLDSKVYNVHLTQWINRKAPPSLIAIEKKDYGGRK